MSLTAIYHLEKKPSVYYDGIKKRIRLCIPFLALLGFICYGNTYKKDMDFWRLNNNVSTYGLGVNMVSTMLNMKLDPPDDYSDYALMQTLEPFETAESNFTPNIIVIMNESFSDLSVLAKNLDNELYMPYYNSLSDNTVKGKVVTSAFGGSTANAEYEFLTGNSLYFMPSHVPYQQQIHQKTYSLPAILKNRGYSTVSIHPFLGSNYNRPAVYTYFDFDQFIDIDSFSDYELVRNRCVSDLDSYEKIVE